MNELHTIPVIISKNKILELFVNPNIKEDGSWDTAEISTSLNKFSTASILKISDSKFFNRSDASNILDVIDEVVTDTDSCINEDIIAKIVGSKIVEKLVKQNMSFINKEIENSAKENNLDKDLLYKIVMYYSTLKEAKIQES